MRREYCSDVTEDAASEAASSPHSHPGGQTMLSVNAEPYAFEFDLAGTGLLIR
jgi:hypothetical protein